MADTHKCPCAVCGTNIEFPKEYLGEQVACPICGVQTILVAPAATVASPQPAMVRAAAPTSVSANGHKPSGLRIGISIVVLLISGLLLLGGTLAYLPLDWVREVSSGSAIRVMLQGVHLLAWFGFAATLINCALLAQVGSWRKPVVLWAAILLALTELFFRGDLILAVALEQKLALPFFLQVVFQFLKPLAIVALSLVLIGRYRWAVMGLGVTALFFFAVNVGIETALRMGVWNWNSQFRLYLWGLWLSFTLSYLLCFAAAAVGLLAVLRQPGQAVVHAGQSAPASVAPRAGGRAKAPTAACSMWRSACSLAGLGPITS